MLILEFDLSYLGFTPCLDTLLNSFAVWEVELRDSADLKAKGGKEVSLLSVILFNFLGSCPLMYVGLGAIKGGTILDEEDKVYDDDMGSKSLRNVGVDLPEQVDI